MLWRMSAVRDVVVTRAGVHLVVALESLTAVSTLLLPVACEVRVPRVVAAYCDGMVALAVAHDVQEGRHWEAVSPIVAIATAVVGEYSAHC